MAQNVFERLVAYLFAAEVEFTVIRHAPVFTSEEAAAIRGTTLSSGAKALVCKTGEGFTMFVLPADRRLASKLVRKLGFRDLRFATPEEVEAATTLAPGSIPPFGSLFGLETWCDERLSKEDRINFNAGDHAISISMSFPEYVRAEHPRMAKLTE